MQAYQTHFRWPTSKLWWIFVSRGALLALLWIVVYGGCSFLTGQHAWRVRLHTDWELGVPFWPQFSIVYLSLFPMLWLSPFVLPSEALMCHFAKALGWLIALSGIGFLLVPGEPAYAPTPVSPHWQPIFNLADQLNLEHNMLPSLHVSMALLCAIAYGQHASYLMKVFYWAWATAIIISVMTLHQHHLVDVLTGALLATVVSRYCLSCSRVADQNRT